MERNDDADRVDNRRLKRIVAQEAAEQALLRLGYRGRVIVEPLPPPAPRPSPAPETDDPDWSGWLARHE